MMNLIGYFHLESGTIFDKAKKLRDMYALKRNDETIYIQFFKVKIGVKIFFK